MVIKEIKSLAETEIEDKIIVEKIKSLANEADRIHNQMQEEYEQCISGLENRLEKAQAKYNKDIRNG